VRSGPSLPNFTLIGAACRPSGVKNPKTGTRVKTIPAELPAADRAGNEIFLAVLRRVTPRMLLLT